MATAVASRFAVLSIDDDDDAPKRNQKKKVETKKTGTSISSQKTDSNQKKKSKKSDPGKPSQSNSNTKSKGKTGKGEGNKDGQQKKKSHSQEQWDQWKKKDSEFVDGHYEQDLHQAILLSKLDYEEKKDLYEQFKKDAEEEKKNAGKRNKKSNRAQTMSLEQFNNLFSELSCESGMGESVANSKGNNEQFEEFFQRIEDDTKKALDREQTLERRKAREPFIQEAITIAQFENTLEERNKEIKSLKEEVVKLKEELHNVKTRNKKLCNILALGEMKDKAEALFEVDKLRRVKDELSTEVSSLHAQLEQERSKVRSLTSDSKSKAQVTLSTRSAWPVKQRRETEHCGMLNNSSVLKDLCKIVYKVASWGKNNCNIAGTRITGIYEYIKGAELPCHIVLKCDFLKISYLLSKSVLSCSGKCVVL